MLIPAARELRDDAQPQRVRDRGEQAHKLFTGQVLARSSTTCQIQLTCGRAGGQRGLGEPQAHGPATRSGTRSGRRSGASSHIEKGGSKEPPWVVWYGGISRG